MAAILELWNAVLELVAETDGSGGSGGGGGGGGGRELGPSWLVPKMVWRLAGAAGLEEIFGRENFGVSDFGDSMPTDSRRASAFPLKYA